MASAAGGSVLHTPLGSFTGAEGPAEFGRELGQSFSNATFTTTSVEHVDNLVVVRFAMTAIHTGYFEGRSGNCASINVPGVAIMQTGSRMAQAENADSGALGQYLDPTYAVQQVVTEQWISYDVDLIGAQIDLYDSVFPNARGNCFSWNPNVAFVESGSPALPPTTDEPAQWGNRF
jgi:hypothetical protein